MLASEALSRYGSQAKAAAALGIARQTFQGRLAAEARKRGGALPAPQPQRPALLFPELPDRDEPMEDLIARVKQHYRRQRNYVDAATWQQIKVSDDLPFGLALMGDVHIDDPGCNWDLLNHDVAIMRDTEGLFTLNVGDYSNNWVGRLARLFANQETSQATARRLVEWLLLKSGIKWAAVVLGNHDEWNDGGEIIRRMVASAKVHIPVHEWAAKIELVFPNGAVCRVNAAHDFKGRSMYSPSFGPMKEAIMNQEGAHINVAGHIHSGGMTLTEIPGGHLTWAVRVGSYKEMDSHALVNGFHESRQMACVCAVIDPLAAPADRVMMFPSLAQGAKALTALRSARIAEAAAVAPVKRKKAAAKPARKAKKGRKRKAA